MSAGELDLGAVPVLVVDVQSTGATPEQGRLLEVAWTTCSADDAGAATTLETHVLSGPEDEVIPARILRLTGIAAAEVAAGTSEAEVFARLDAALGGVSTPVGLAVAHWARFETRFLADLWQRHAAAALPLAFLCTHQVSRRLWPQLPSGSLRSVAGWVGHAVASEKRAKDHVAATVSIWRRLCEELRENHGIRTLSELRAWLEVPVDKTKGKPKRVYPMPRETRLGVPRDPGVYRMLAADKRVLYVGKATSLRDRVNSYFRQQRGHNSLKLELLSQAVGLDVTPCATAVEAALLETDEIKRLDPPYNSALKREARTVAWLGRDLLPVDIERGDGGDGGEGGDGEGAKAAAKYGPFCPADALMPLHLVALALRDPAAGLPRIAGLLWREAALEALVEGFALFSAEWRGDGTEPPGPRGLLARVLPEARRQEKEAAALAALAALTLGDEDGHAASGDDGEEDDEDDKEGEDEEDEEEQPLTAADVAAWLSGLMVSMARTFLRARRVAAFADTVVAWRASDDAPWRWLRLSRGAVVDRGDAADAAEVPLPEPKRAGAHTELPVVDVATWDRLRVLTTELGVIVRDGGQAMVRRPAPQV
jgi:DNA polymerase-3 subunit epsilon